MSTATSVPGLRVGPVLGRRACAALALTSAGLHAAMLGHASNVVAGGLLAAMIVACVYCARDLWLRGTLRAWCAVGLMNIAMIAVHMPMPAHHHGMHASGGPAVDADGSRRPRSRRSRWPSRWRCCTTARAGNAQLISGRPAR